MNWITNGGSYLEKSAPSNGQSPVLDMMSYATVSNCLEIFLCYLKGLGCFTRCLCRDNLTSCSANTATVLITGRVSVKGIFLWIRGSSVHARMTPSKGSLSWIWAIIFLKQSAWLLLIFPPATSRINWFTISKWGWNYYLSCVSRNKGHHLSFHLSSYSKTI